MNSKKYKVRKIEEIVNSASHGVGTLLAIAATTLLIIRGALHGNAWHIVTYSIFGAGLINLYTASTLFHGAINPRVKFNLNKFDHSSIYILIAATYTPFSLLSIKGWLGWTIFGVEWGLAIAGVIFKIGLLSKTQEPFGLAIHCHGLGWANCRSAYNQAHSGNVVMVFAGWLPGLFNQCSFLPKRSLPLCAWYFSSFL
jgi:Predicted membrane protein, hemolysin III homolog